MNDSMYKGEILSFFKLLKKYKIEIPIIQRDYAQGRKDQQEIRNNFLNALYESLDESRAIKLDFIYGSNIDDSFQPLDGQQRLTTLFLLHWYAAAKCGVLNQENKDILNKFSYETRITSRDFCKSLINNPININVLDEKLSLRIIDSPWFYLSWKKDPTIDAMLRTIDDIHIRFNDFEDLWDLLVNDCDLITFYHVKLENIGLTDDLYIKMNARGKLLSSFENFKASFQKYLFDKKWETNKTFPETFACKIDTKWTDYFWSHFKKFNSIDDAFMRFISTIAMIRHSIEKTDDRYNTISKLQENSNYVKSELFTEDGFKYLYKCFEIYQKVITQDINLTLYFPLWQHEPHKNIFSAIIFDDNSASYTQKVLFYAQTEYLIRIKDFSLNNFNDWMRVVRNIVSRGDIERNGNRPAIIRSPQTFDGVINLISELAEGCGVIYEHLSNIENLRSSFAKDQIEEEKAKAKLIEANNNHKKIIFDAEDNDLLRGKIEFVFFCTDYDYNIDNFNLESFKKIQKVITKYFHKEVDISNELRRALLTIEVEGKYEYYGYWWSFWNVVSANKRCLIDNYRELEYYIYSDYKVYFKKLIVQLIDKNLKEIIQSFDPPVTMPNWKKRLIIEADLLDKKSKSNYIAIPDDNNCCYLLRSKRPREIEGCVKIE